MAKKNTVSSILVGKKKTKSVEPQKRSVIVHEKNVPTKNLHEVLGQTEKTIQELSRYLAELPQSARRGVGGQLSLTTKEKLIIKELEEARKRADRILKLIENS